MGNRLDIASEERILSFCLAMTEFHKGAKMKPTDAHVIRNILIQMLVNTRTPEPMDDLIPAHVEDLKTLFKATYLNDS